VRPLVVVVPQVLVEDPLKVAPAPDQQPVQTLLPDRPHPPLGERIGIRRLDARRDDLGAVGHEHAVEGARDLAVAVTNDEARRAALRSFPLPFHHGLPCLLDHPRPVRMIGDPDEPNPPRPKFDDEQDIQRREPHSLHMKKSTATMPAACVRRNARLVTDARRGAGPKPFAAQHRGWWSPTPTPPA
jgi:hypothetical protein